MSVCASEAATDSSDRTKLSNTKTNLILIAFALLGLKSKAACAIRLWMCTLHEIFIPVGSSAREA